MILLLVEQDGQWVSDHSVASPVLVPLLSFRCCIGMTEGSVSCTERYWDGSADESDSPAKGCCPLVEVVGFPHSAESRSLRAASSSIELKERSLRA